MVALGMFLGVFCQLMSNWGNCLLGQLGSGQLGTWNKVIFGLTVHTHSAHKLHTNWIIKIRTCKQLVMLHLLGDYFHSKKKKFFFSPPLNTPRVSLAWIVCGVENEKNLQWRIRIHQQLLQRLTRTGGEKKWNANLSGWMAFFFLFFFVLDIATGSNRWRLFLAYFNICTPTSLSAFFFLINRFLKANQVNLANLLSQTLANCCCLG